MFKTICCVEPPITGLQLLLAMARNLSNKHHTLNANQVGEVQNGAILFCDGTPKQRFMIYLVDIPGLQMLFSAFSGKGRGRGGKAGGFLLVIPYEMFDFCNNPAYVRLVSEISLVI